jgi:competence protein ComEA
MWEEPWSAREKRWAVVAGVLTVLLIILLLYLWWGPQEAKEETAALASYHEAETVKPRKQKATKESTLPADVTVDVKGAVEAPGVYRLPSKARVLDAVNKAGGASSKADMDQVNLAQPLTDGMVVWIPKKGEKQPPAVASGSAPGSSDSAVQSSSGTGSAGGKININTATAAELDELNGIGPSKAEAIVRYREENGPFTAVEDLLEVPGIGEKTLEQFREQITVG